MHSFIYLPEYLVVICKECKVGISIDGINSHLIDKKHKDIASKEKKRIIAHFS